MNYGRRRASRLTGPVRLIVQAVAALLAIGALCAAAVLGFSTARTGTAALREAVEGRAAVAAELHFALADLDAERADELIPGHAVDQPEVPVGNRLLALITANQRRTEISGLVRQLGGDPAQGARVREVFDALGRYDELSGQAEYADDQDADRAAGHPPTSAVNLSAQAGAVMHDQLLPAVDALNQTYQRQAADLRGSVRDGERRDAVVLGALGVLALGVLVWWQRDLALRYRRRVNPALAVATLTVLAVMVVGTAGLLAGAGEVDRAGAEGLGPWSRLAEARTTAADAAAAQSRWFVQAPGAAAAYRDDYNTQMGRLDGLLTAGPGTSAAELPQYAAVLKPLAAFRADDQTLRGLLAAGRLDDAAVVLTEVGRDHVAFDYWDFATRLDALEQTRRADFEARMAAAGRALDGWPAIPVGTLVGAAVLVLAGVRPRLAEYR
ncbi:hypothetical protein [Streptantibioticus ferralitis]|uniref:Secreted protein n=1 Tax=Streptantibioticus ferralitis TaxID=236510 RepID=A0ABT5YXV5_9ACTN|nr:hypothetical protein [Streptantibioticus ferralitis]MDF2256323.1 hypothetical protein [Streptantibioticus ferralitis]